MRTIVKVEGLEGERFPADDMARMLIAMLNCLSITMMHPDKCHEAGVKITKELQEFFARNLSPYYAVEAELQSDGKYLFRAHAFSSDLEINKSKVMEGDSIIHFLTKF